MRSLHVKLSVPVATAGDSSGFRQVQGQIKLTPTSGNHGVPLSIPYYLVVRARSQVMAHLLGEFEHRSTGTVRVSNQSNSITGTADFYAWGLRGNNTSLGPIGLRAVGVQSFSDPTFGEILVFAVNTFGAPSNPVTNVYDVLLDVNGDGTPDYDVEAADLGLLTTGSFNGEMAVAVFNLATGSGVLEFLATAPTDGTTILMPLVASDVGVTSANPRFSYVAQTLDLFSGNVDAITRAGSFNAFHSSISTGAFAVLPPRANTNVPITLDRNEFRITPALGAMVVSLDNLAKGNRQALLLSVSGH